MIRVAPHLAKHVTSLDLDAGNLADPALPGPLAALSNVHYLSIRGRGKYWGDIRTQALIDFIYKNITSLRLYYILDISFSALICPISKT